MLQVTRKAKNTNLNVSNDRTFEPLGHVHDILARVSKNGSLSLTGTIHLLP